jgi:hypothetical protein
MQGKEEPVRWVQQIPGKNGPIEVVGKPNPSVPGTYLLTGQDEIRRALEISGSRLMVRLPAAAGLRLGSVIAVDEAWFFRCPREATAVLHVYPDSTVPYGHVYLETCERASEA